MLTDEDKKWLKENCGKVERIGLYIMVILIWIHSCSGNCNTLDRSDNKNTTTNIVIESKQ